MPSKSQVQKRGPTSPQMNLTPLIDVVFQLIIFFMLVNNIITQEAIPMIPPVMEEDPDVDQIPEERLVINLVLEGGEGDRDRGPDYLNIRGRVGEVHVGSVARFRLGDMDQVTAVLNAERERYEQRDQELRLLVRADSGTVFRDVFPVLQAIAAARIRDVNLVAYAEDQPMMRPPEPQQ